MLSREDEEVHGSKSNDCHTGCPGDTMRRSPVNKDIQRRPLRRDKVKKDIRIKNDGPQDSKWDQRGCPYCNKTRFYLRDYDYSLKKGLTEIVHKDNEMIATIRKNVYGGR